MINFVQAYYLYKNIVSEHFMQIAGVMQFLWIHGVRYVPCDSID